MAKVVLVTGASTGLGREIAAHLAAQGYTVFGTSRHPDPDDTVCFEMLPLDVTDAESVEGCVRMVLERAGRLDVLVNNAAVMLFGALEETAIDEAKWLFDTNFFGAARMAKAVIPHMRVRGGGLIINMSSIAGRSGTPYHGYYGASKHALEAYTEALRHELLPFGIHVSLVEPGFFRSEIGVRRRTATEAIPAYSAIRVRFERRWDHLLDSGPHPRAVAILVQQIIDSADPKLRYLVGFDAVWRGTIMRFVPDRWIEIGVRDWMGIAQPADRFFMLTRFGGLLIGSAILVRALGRTLRRR